MRSLKSVRLFAMCAALAGAGCTTNSTSNAGQGNPDAGIAEADAQSEAEGESKGETKGAIVCEDQDYAQADFDAAFDTARDALAAEGYEVTPVVWEDEEGFNRLIDQMILALDCTPKEQSSRRAGPGSCEIVTDFARYQSDVAYCGSGARRQPCVRRVIPGNCLNEVCQRHDLCYSELIAEQGPICMWSNDTERCDAAFHRGSAACLVRLQCGFQCRLIATAAANLDLLQEIGKLRGEECLYGADPDSDGDDYSRFADNDCDDGNAAINPGATEVCDGVDNDCDNVVDEGFADLDNPCTVGVGACARSDIWTCSDDYLSVVCPAISILALPSPEVCDGVDNDCDGAVDEGAEVAELCQDGIFCNGEERCEVGRCAIGTSVACDDGVSCTADYCSESSRACSAVADHARCDDGTVCTTDRCTPTGCVNAVTLDADGDGFFAASCVGGTDCNDGNAAVNPDADEVCNGVDDDCDGVINEGIIECWSSTNDIGAPTARYAHTAVWTGSEMIVWGGTIILGDGGGWDPSTGGKYDPALDIWSSTTTSSAPAGRYAHTAVWTGSEMIVWGGVSGYFYFGEGGKYDPLMDSWIPVASSGAPSARFDHTAVWTGSEMIVWGGNSGGFLGVPLGDGGRYDPESDMWTSLPVISEMSPTARCNHATVWTGSEMIVWGGYGEGRLTTGGRYNPASNTWSAILPSITPCREQVVWTGTEMISPGMACTGQRYNPSINTWTAISRDGEPSGRANHTVIWTGSEMIVWGGNSGSGYLNTGGRYDPIADTWSMTLTISSPLARNFHTAVWTGSEMVIWGGQDATSLFNTGGRYTPP